MTFEIRPLSATLGAEVLGLNLSKPLSEHDFARVYQAWLDHLVLVFRDQELSEEEHIAFSKRFGGLEVHINKKGLHLQHPEIYVLSNVLEAGKEVGKGSTPYWHSDLTYMEKPAKASMLYGREVPEVGGDTLYANMYMAYEQLPDDVKNLLEGKFAVHNIADFGTRYLRFTGDEEALKRTAADDPVIRAMPDVKHPVVIRHPETGRPSLYVNRGFTTRILELPESESDRLLELLFEHSTRPEFTYRKMWRPHDLTMWDNRCTIHTATGGYEAPMRRLMHRTTIAGDSRFEPARKHQASTVVRHADINT